MTGPAAAVPSVPPAPTPERERLLTPDLARGVMLLLIALAHSRMLHAGGNALAAPAGGGPLDVALQAVLTSLVDGRAAPLFGFLFGYGLVQMTRRHGDARSLIRRRGVWLVVFGAVHVVALYGGDIIGVYGVVAVLFAGAVAWSPRRLWTVAAVTVVAGALLLGVVQAVVDAGAALPVGPTLLDSALIRASGLPLLPLLAVVSVAPVLIGVRAGQRRLLEAPERHAPLLRRVALVGFPVAVLGALPVTLQAVGVWSPASFGADVVALAVFSLTGLAGGLAYAALIALAAWRIGSRAGWRPGWRAGWRHSPVVTALTSCGRRSMTFYVAQSPVWLVATEPALLDLGGRLSVTAATGVAVATWVVTVLLALALDRAGRRGPLEALLRRLTYRTPATTREDR